MPAPEVVTLGSCYIDFISTNLPFGAQGIAPEQEVIGGRYAVQAGGSAVNFCRILGKLGISPTFVGAIGSDLMGSTLKTLLARENIHARLHEIEGEQTQVSFNLSNADNDHVMEVLGTANSRLTYDDMGETLESALDGADYLYLGGVYKLKGLWDDLEDLVWTARQKKAGIILDHGRVPADAPAKAKALIRSLVVGADYYFPSKREFLNVWEVEKVEQGLWRLHEQAPQLTTVVKDGHAGVLYLAGGEIITVPPPEVVRGGDVAGAGDSFNAGTIRAIAARRNLHESVIYGCSVAAAKVANKELPKLENQ